MNTSTPHNHTLYTLNTVKLDKCDHWDVCTITKQYDQQRNANTRTTREL